MGLKQLSIPGKGDSKEEEQEFDEAEEMNIEATNLLGEKLN